MRAVTARTIFERCCDCAGLKAESELATLVTRSMQEKDNGSIELLLVLDSILQVRVNMRAAMGQHAAACSP